MLPVLTKVETTGEVSLWSTPISWPSMVCTGSGLQQQSHDSHMTRETTMVHAYLDVLGDLKFLLPDSFVVMVDVAHTMPSS